MRAPGPVEKPRGHPTARPSFGIAFAWTWLLWGSTAATGASLAEPAGGLLSMTRGLGPLLATAWLLRRSDRR